MVLLTSIDRVFFKAITTIRALSSRSNYGTLPRPPAENRIRLYGLYKQATEGDVDGVMPRPVGFTPEDEGAKKKWDAWKREQGLSKTEAKRRYIQYLIETMKIYASGTQEARELLNELEYLWEQIKNLPWEDNDGNNSIDYPVPTMSPSISDRYSVATPINQNYRNSLQRIYSHSRRSTLDHGVGGSGSVVAAGGAVGGHSLGAGPPSIQSLPERKQHPHYQQPPPTNRPVPNSQSIDEFKSWQSEINVIVNKLSRDYVNTKRSINGLNNSLIDNLQDNNDDELDPNVILKRRIIKILKTIGMNMLKFAKSFSISCLALLFLVWCTKKNVVVNKTYMKQQDGKSELIVNMFVNTNENKWFIRLLKFIDTFVGFTK